MKKLLILTILISLVISCLDSEKSEFASYEEDHPSFFYLRNSDWTKNSWIRKPANLKIVHESFKKFGYDKLENLIFKGNKEFLVQEIYIKRNFQNVMDSLELTYNNPEKQNKYYSDFWNRRKAENNDSIVYEIVREFNSVRSDRKQLDYNNQFVNDTLVDLLKIEFATGTLNSEKAKSDFYILKKYGLHQSAYNLLYERSEYSELDLDREDLKKELKKSTENHQAWLIGNAK